MIFNVNTDGRLDISVKYSGFVERVSIMLLKKRIEDFISNINEIVRLERIKRRI
jgi:hypothetical protein